MILIHRKSLTKSWYSKIGKMLMMCSLMNKLNTIMLEIKVNSRHGSGLCRILHREEVLPRLDLIKNQQTSQKMNDNWLYKTKSICSFITWTIPRRNLRKIKPIIQNLAVESKWKRNLHIGPIKINIINRPGLCNQNNINDILFKIIIRLIL